MAISCGIFWDMQNIDVPKGSSVEKVFSLIESNVIERCCLRKTGVYVVHDDKLPEEHVHSLSKLPIDYTVRIRQKNTPNAADEQLVSFMKIWHKTNRGVIILLSGDGDFVTSLKIFQSIYNSLIYVIRLGASCSEKFTDVADRIFLLTKDQLEQVYTNRKYWNLAASDECPYDEDSIENLNYTFSWKTYVKITCVEGNLPVKSLGCIKTDLRSYNAWCSIVYKDDVWGSFSTLSKAKSSLVLTGSYSFDLKRYNIKASIESPPEAVINLMICAWFKNKEICHLSVDWFVMPDYKSKDGDTIDCEENRKRDKIIPWDHPEYIMKDSNDHEVVTRNRPNKSAQDEFFESFLQEIEKNEKSTEAKV